VADKGRIGVRSHLDDWLRVLPVDDTPEGAR
jgi:hypothetical protein